MDSLPKQSWGITYLHYVRLTVALNASNVQGKLTTQMQGLSDEAVDVLVSRDPRFFTVLDPRELLPTAGRLMREHGNFGLMNLNALAACIDRGSDFYTGNSRVPAGVMADHAPGHGVTINLV